MMGFKVIKQYDKRVPTYRLSEQWWDLKVLAIIDEAHEWFVLANNDGI